MLTALLGFLGSSGVLKKVLDYIPNPLEREKAKMEFEMEMMKNEQELIKLVLQSDVNQVEVNKEEAKSSSVFVAGARPFIMWVCGASFAWTFVIQPFVLFFFYAFGHPITGLPKLDMGEMMPVLLGTLGLGGLRSWEKSKGVSREKL